MAVVNRRNIFLKKSERGGWSVDLARLMHRLDTIFIRIRLRSAHETTQRITTQCRNSCAQNRAVICWTFVSLRIFYIRIHRSTRDSRRVGVQTSIAHNP